jgi:hypothetical protein
MKEWKNLKDGIEFVIYLTHGDADSETNKKIRIELNEKDKFEKIFKIISFLNEGIARNFEKNTEDVAKYISKKTNYTEDDIMNVIGDIVITDVTFEAHMAMMSHFEVFKYDNGTIQKLYF